MQNCSGESCKLYEKNHRDLSKRYAKHSPPRGGEAASRKFQFETCVICIKADCKNFELHTDPAEMATVAQTKKLL
jgi:hypothetical protein